MAPKNTKRYQKKDPIEHALTRSDMYVGSTRLRSIQEYLGYKDNKYHIVCDTLKTSPAILRIFVEALSNAIDNVERSKNTGTPCTKIKVNINPETGETSIWNDGDVVPIEIDPDEKCYIHSMVFGQLLTGSNYDDEEERIVSGRNGLGVKLCLGLGTLIPKFDGNISKIEDISIGDNIIGSDGLPRKVIAKTTGEGRLFKISQPRGEPYIVNQHHLLTVKMPDHKVIFWNTAKNGWSMLWLDTNKRKIESKTIRIAPKKILCQECNTYLSSDMSRHYRRKHPSVEYKKIRKSPEKNGPDTEEVKAAKEKLEEFAKNIPDNNIMDISVGEYQKLPTSTKGRLSGFKAPCVMWSHNPVDLDPYILGVWLGDGSKRGYSMAINSDKDPEILDYFTTWTKENNCHIYQSANNKYCYYITSLTDKVKNNNCLAGGLRKYDLLYNKHIPKEYILNDKETRLKVLAGIIDSDGTVHNDGSRITIAQGLEHKQLCDDIIFMARSLGFMCSWHIKDTTWTYKGEKFSGKAININISGECIEQIPTLVKRKCCFSPKKRCVINTGPLTVTEIESGGFVGLQVDGDNRFVLNDFTITHNCNIFSTKFRVSGCDTKNGKTLVQEWTNNMRETEGPVVKDSKLKKGYTEVCWTPDFPRFELTKYTPDIVRLYTRYVLDAAMLSKVDVYLNNELIPVRSITDYAALYDTPSEEKLYIKTKNTEVFLTPAREFQTVSFVNGVYTRLGGQHVEAWVEALFRPIVDKFNGKDKKLKTKTPKINITDVKQFFRLIVVATVVRPEFDAQDKCLDPGTPILTWDNGKKTAKDICLGDSIIGSDGLPHKVNKITQGNDLMYEISQSRGDTYIVNSQHTLCMICPEHKKINFQPKNNLYTLRWYDTSVNNLRIKRVKVCENKTAYEAQKELEDYAEKIPDSNIFDIPLYLYNSLNQRTKESLYGFKMRVPILWDSQPVFLDPYILGMWLGDGDTKGRAFTSADKELIDYWCEWGRKNNASIVHYRKYYYGVVNYEGITNNINHRKFKNPLEEQLKQYNLVYNKHIPNEYIYNSQEVRLQLLAGIVDTDGCVQDNGTSLIIVQGMNHTKLTEDIIILVKSLGLNCLHRIKNTTWTSNFEVKTGKAHHLHISGNIDKIPVKLERKIGKKPSITTGISKIKVKSKGYGPYVGFELENHSRFLLGDFTITHNCKLESPTVEAEVKRNHIATITKWSVMDRIEDIIRAKEMVVLKKAEKVGKKTKIEGYDPANKAGGKDSINCSLFITEGLSAKTYVVSGLDVGIYGRRGRDWNGVLPVRGKLLNVRDKPATTIADNKVICSLIHSLGLKHGTDYLDDNNFKKLNYGRLVIVADADVDGIHIEGLILNFIHSLYPSLLERKEPFVISLKTPIARVKKSKATDMLFYDERRFHNWLGEQNGKVDAKYYKGLGTTKPEDVPDTFGKKLVEFNTDDKTFDNMQKAFHKKYADSRKEWLGAYDPEVSTFSLDDVDTKASMSITNFVNGELIKFSHADCARSIPSGIDGLKESQRKILYAVKKRKLKYSGKSLKVAQLAGYTAEHSNYHHGENNLFDTIVGMAHEYPGTNNIPLLYRDGQFGTRLEGGADAAAARYIYTKMDALTELIYREEDEPLLKQVNDDGDLVQPVHYVPILPMILINGCAAGIGTGWSCNVPCFNPLDMIKAIKVWLENDGEVLIENPENPDETISMFSDFVPWYRGFKGDIEKSTDTRFITYGVVEEQSKDEIHIKELPIGMWTSKFADFCDDLKADKKLKSVNNYSSPKDVHFVVKEGEDFRCDLNTMKLHSYIYTSNMVTFNEKEQLRKYDTVDQILDNFCRVRYDYYVKRKRHQINSLEVELRFLGNKERFVSEVISGELNIMNVEEEELVKELKNRGYDEDPKKEEGEGGYDYLLRMPVRSLTANKVKQLKNDIASTQEKLDGLRATTEKAMWLNELDEFEKAYVKWVDDINNQVVATKKVSKKKK